MITASVGEVVHYTPQAGSHACHAGIVTGHDNTGGLILRILAPFTFENDHTAFPDYDTIGASIDGDGDTHSTYAGFTAGTWHHIH